MGVRQSCTKPPKQSDASGYDSEFGIQTVIVEPLLASEERVFEKLPKICSEDERTARSWNPITERTQYCKFSALLPPKLVRSRTVLDLGACLGAAGHWCMHFGAKKYTGVDVQRDFMTRAATFAAQAGWQESQMEFVCSDVRKFLASLPDNCYDVVVCAGLLHCFVDPQTIVQEAGRVAKIAVVVENNYPPLVRRSIVPEHAAIYVVQLLPHSLVNYAGGPHSLQGLGATISLEAIAVLLRLTCNFSIVEHVQLATLSPRPGVSGHSNGTDESVRRATAVYDDVKHGHATPRRFFARYYKDTSSSSHSTLEEGLNCGDVDLLVPWTGVADRCVAEHKADSRKASAASLAASRYVGQKHSVAGGWVFDKNVARSFASEASLNIPSYEEVISKSIALVKANCGKSSGSSHASTSSGASSGTHADASSSVSHTYAHAHAHAHARVIDVGCATGKTLLHLHAEGFLHVYGVDNAQAMIDHIPDACPALPSDAYTVMLGESFPRGIPLDASGEYVGSGSGEASDKACDKASDKTGGGARGVSEGGDASSEASGAAAAEGEAGAMGAASVGPETHIGLFDAVIANWTLHFIVDPSKRRAYLQDVYTYTKPGGCLVLTDKMLQSEAVKAAYRQFKMDNGMSLADVERKARMIEDILVPLPVSWYLQTLESLGFHEIEVMHAHLGFTSIVAYKPVTDEQRDAFHG